MERLIEISKKITELLDEANSLRPEIPNTSSIHFDTLESLEKNYFILNQINDKSEKIIKKNKMICGDIYNISKKFRQKLNKFYETHNNNKFLYLFDDGLKILSKEYFKNMSIKIMQDPEEQELKMYKSVELIPDFAVSIPIIQDLNLIEPAFVWYCGDSKNKEGVYMSLDKMIIQVPFPDLIAKNSPNFKFHSMPCKNNTYAECSRKLKEVARVKGTLVRQCTYTHIGEKYYKIGSDFRAPGLTQFGSHKTLAQDIKDVQLFDIKNILMNASSDLLLIKLWHEKHKKIGNIIFNDLDIA